MSVKHYLDHKLHKHVSLSLCVCFSSSIQQYFKSGSNEDYTSARQRNCGSMGYTTLRNGFEGGVKSTSYIHRVVVLLLLFTILLHAINRTI